MAKLSSTLRNMLLSLTGICIIVSGILALVNKVTKAPIEEAQVKAKVEAISAVTPKFDNNPFAERLRFLPEGESDSLTVYPAKMGGQLVGFAIESYTLKGFSGLISVMVGFDASGKLVDFSVLQHAESPGLGSLIPEWFHEKSQTGGIRDMRGLDMKAVSPLSVSKDGGKVDAITAATISSRAFLDAVNRAWSVFTSLQAQGLGTSSGNGQGGIANSATPRGSPTTSQELPLIPQEGDQQSSQGGEEVTSSTYSLYPMNPLAIIRNGITTENPTFVLLLGMCPTLATTSSAANGMAMGLATMFVLICSNTVISMIKSLVPDAVRIPSFIVVIAGFVTIVQLLMQAYVPSLYASLGLFIPLIVVNCIVLGRAEAVAAKQPVLHSTLDGLGIGLGFTCSLTLLGFVRELLGAGTIFGHAVYPKEYGALLFVLAPGAFIVLGYLIALSNKIGKKK